jgi:tRNA(Ile2) C34 agmatinyltransferase TiaS
MSVPVCPDCSAEMQRVGTPHRWRCPWVTVREDEEAVKAGAVLVPCGKPYTRTGAGEIPRRGMDD